MFLRDCSCECSVGVKVRLAKAVSNGGTNEREGFKRALQVIHRFK